MGLNQQITSKGAGSTPVIFNPADEMDITPQIDATVTQKPSTPGTVNSTMVATPQLVSAVSSTTSLPPPTTISKPPSTFGYPVFSTVTPRFGSTNVCHKFVYGSRTLNCWLCNKPERYHR